MGILVAVLRVAYSAYLRAEETAFRQVVNQRLQAAGKGTVAYPLAGRRRACLEVGKVAYWEAWLQGRRGACLVEGKGAYLVLDIVR